jgi:putative transcriptional regulator
MGAAKVLYLVHKTFLYGVRYMESRLKEIAHSRGIKQKWVEEQAGISHSAMSALWTGKSEPTLKSARAISKVLGVSIDEIWPDEKAPGR